MSTTGHPQPAPYAGVFGLLGLRFLTELALIAAAAVAAADLVDGRPLSIAAAVVGASLVVLVWAAVVAPRARRRLADPWRLVLELIMFLASAAGLAHAGHPIVAVTYGAIGAGMAIAVRVWAPDS